MHIFKRIRLRMIGGLTAALLTALVITGNAAMATTATATQVLPPFDDGGTVQPALAPVVAGGMPGWQITLIAVGAALVAAALAVLADRAWSARRRLSVAPASVPAHVSGVQ